MSVKVRPTRLGYYLLGLNFILFLLATGYSNNLIFLFSLILIGQTLFWYAETVKFGHSGIKDLKVSNCFAGETTILSCSIEESRFNKLILEINGSQYKVDHFVRDTHKVIISLILPQRGKYLLEKITFYDSRPYGLFAKKIAFKAHRQFYVYPQIIKNVSLNNSNDEESESGSLDSNTKGEESFWGLNPYQGEDFKKISWKHYARTENVYVKQGVQPSLSHFHFILSDRPSEEELSRTASLMLLAHLNQSMFSLKLGDLLIQPEIGQSHLDHCLARLAEC